MTDIPILDLGRQGDGLATIEGEPCFVPFTLPGETVRVTGSGRRRVATEIISPSPDRVEPICEHFGACGGCQLQHLQDDRYDSWKVSLLRDSLNGAGIELEPDALVTFPAASRRKAVFHVCRTDGKLAFGFARRGSNAIIDIAACPVLVTELAEMIGPLRDLSASLPLGRRPVSLSVLASEQSCDVDLDGGLKLSESQRSSLSSKAVALGFARLSHGGDIIIEPHKPSLEMGNVQVVPPPGAFVQAVAGAEFVMGELVCEHLSRCKQVADLYCGIGTFALRLAVQSQVLAVEESAAAIAALDRAWRTTGGALKQIRTEVRNLERRPVSFQELKKTDGVVFDPPRAGAELQSRQIAKSRVRRVAAVSCNPQTLARDLTILIEGGYQLTRLVPIDQFRFTPHLEIVALLER